MRDFSLASSTRRSTILLGTLVVVALALMLLDSRGLFTAPRRLATTLIDPATERLSSLGERIRGTGSSDSELQRELDDVTAERDSLLAENAELKAVAEEVEALNEALQLQQSRPDLTLVYADVMLGDPQSRDKFIVISKGSNDGLQLGMPVLSPNFLVGYITEVEPNRARILLVIDAQFQTGARLLDIQGEGAEGIVYGQWQLGGRVIMRHVARDIDVPLDSVVVTSGKSVGIPAGLIIGTVREVKRNDLQNEMELDLVPQVDFDDLSSVAVIVSATGTGAPPAAPETPADPTPTTEGTQTP